jgi:hypothetical protein
MAKHVITEQYSFTPSTKTIVVTGKNIRREQLLLITNTTAGTVIYNFSDPSLGCTLTNSTNTATGLETTTIVTTYNTAAMASTDKLAILTEETYQEIIPSEVMRDPVEKLRVSEGQALIDTDFEYGLQPTKWEQLNLLNNRPSAFYDVTNPLTITGIGASGKVVTVLTTANLSNGTPVFVQGTLDQGNADGWWMVESSNTTQFTYTANNTPSATLYDSTKTFVYSANFFTGAAIPVGTGGASLSGSVMTITTTNAHGLRVGDGVYVVNASGQTGVANNGSYIVATTPTNNTFTVPFTGTGTYTLSANTSIYPRALGYVEHRAMLGAVQFTNLSPVHGYQVIRQTRRQFRYQSGKGIQMSTGSILKPTIYTDSITSSGTTVTVTSKFPHGLLAGGVIVVSGCDQTAYNGTFTVVSAPTPTSFTYTAGSTPSATPATSVGQNIIVSPSTWYGGSNRVGMFDSQNGFYFEYDGQTLYAVKRSSTKFLSGVVSAVPQGNLLTGTNTLFSSQLKPGDYIVLRGMSYLVQTIISDTSMQIYPEFRGTSTISNAMLTKTVNTRYPQSQWNIDPCNGTGTSLFNLDLTKMQMFYMDFTWYGAGAIRFGFKNNRGEVIYAHRIPNNNLNTEAYLRSGNLVTRYETNTIPYTTYLTSTLASSATTGATIAVADASLWPATGTAVLTQATATGAQIEYVSYTAKSNTSLTIGTRAVTGGASSAQTFTYSATAPIQVELYAPQIASTIGHWGCSVIMDGKFDDDKGYVFNAGMNTVLTNQTSGTRFALMSLRLAPSIDQGISGLLGVREILNRMQLKLNTMDAYCSGTTFRIELLLNGRPASGTFAPVGGSSLAQITYHAANTTISAGESVYSFFTNVGNATTQDLTIVRDIGTSILSGGTSLNVPTTPNNLYPDGPDVITVCATAFSGTNSIQARLSWTEAQA